MPKLDLSMLPPGNATAKELNSLKTCPQNQGNKTRSAERNATSENTGEEPSSATIFLVPSLQTLPFLVGVITAVAARLVYNLKMINLSSAILCRFLDLSFKPYEIRQLVYQIELLSVVTIRP